MTTCERPARRSCVWVLATGALLVVLLVVLIVRFVLGLTWDLALILLVGVALAVAVWAVFRLRAERAAHEAALASWAASEAIVAERLRIARDLHDIVSHGLGTITVRAAAARHLNAQDTSGRALLEAIEDVETLSRQATLELRRMLETLREGDGPAP